jgi:hypothetical protein
MLTLLIGITIGAVFSPILIKLFKLGWKKLYNAVDEID